MQTWQKLLLIPRHIVTKNSFALMIGLGSALLALLASFGLSTWAELSPLHHGLQHVLLFLGGVGVGGALFSRLRGGKH